MTMTPSGRTVTQATGAASPGGRFIPWRESRRLRAGSRRPVVPYLFIAPATLVIAVLVLYPLARSLYESLHTDNLLSASHAFSGLRNYTQVLADPAFQRAALNTLAYLVLASIGTLAGGLAMALWLHSLRRWRGLFLATVVVPWAVPGTVNGLLWLFILNPSTGLLNSVLQALGVISQPHVWLNGSYGSIAFISLSLIWQVTPISAIILLAGMEGIPSSLYEQASVDGATRWQAFRGVTLPLLRPAIAISLVNAGILGIGVFDQVYVLTGNAPGTISAVIQTYLYAFRDLNFGSGIAASMFVTIAALVISLIYLKGLYREIEY